MTDLLAAIDRHTARLVADARACADLGAPSLCAGWTRDHVLNHLARNAEALCRLVRAAVDGTGETMYASPERRDSDIEAGVGRAPEEVVADVEDTAVPLAAALRRLSPEHRDVVLERTPAGPTFKGGRLPFLRLREVVYHHVDLDVGFGFDDLSPDLQRLFLEDELRRQQGAADPPALLLRGDEGDTWQVGDTEDVAPVTGPRAGLLHWLARQDPSGVRSESLPAVKEGL